MTVPYQWCDVCAPSSALSFCQWEGVHQAARQPVFLFMNNFQLYKQFINTFSFLSSIKKYKSIDKAQVPFNSFLPLSQPSPLPLPLSPPPPPPHKVLSWSLRDCYSDFLLNHCFKYFLCIHIHTKLKNICWVFLFFLFSLSLYKIYYSKYFLLLAVFTQQYLSRWCHRFTPFF